MSDIPSLPPFFDMKYTSDTGKLTPESKMYNDNMFQSLNTLVETHNENLSSDGYVIPNKTTVEIASLETDASVGTIWFNTTLLKLQVKTASGTIETITST